MADPQPQNPTPTTLTPEALQEATRRHREAGRKLREIERRAAGILPPPSPADPDDARQRHSDQTALRQQATTRRLNEVGPPGPPANPRRRRAAEKSLLKFLTTYFPATTGRKPFGDDHKRIIAAMEHCIRHGGRLVNAVYRGFAKTTIAENAALWATLCGYRRFVLITAINMEAASKILTSIKRELDGNDLLAADFPEVCKYIRALEDKAWKAQFQTCEGRRTFIAWKSSGIVLPTIQGSKASAATIVVKPFAKVRGTAYKRPDGEQVRPDLVLNDDPQSDETAATQLQVNKNLSILHTDILQAAGHETRIACIVNGTVIAASDMLENLLADPAWQGVRVPLVKRWADAHDSFWLKEYAAARRDFDRSVPGDQDRAHAAATSLYRARRKEADAGCEVSWRDIPKHPGELSAIQHAYNLLIDNGPEVFAREYQQQPLEADASSHRLTAAAVAAKCNGLGRGAVPKECRAVVAGIDVHDRLLYWLVMAIGDGFRGAVIDYGTWPKQPATMFAMTGCPKPLTAVYPGCVQDAYIAAGLRDCAAAVLDRVYYREDSAPMRVDKLLIDAHWSQQKDTVLTFCRRHPDYNRVVLPSFGFALKPGESFHIAKKPGAKKGPSWVIPPAEGGQLHVTFDPDFGKSQVAQRLSVAMGTPGGWDLFGSEPKRHALLAEHCTSERGVEISRGEHRKESWEILPSRDNHWWDNLVQCFFAGLVAGVALPGIEQQSRRRGRSTEPGGRLLTMAELAAAAKARKGAA
jgi:hypothetical protein